MNNFKWGWNSLLEEEYAPFREQGLHAGRVVKESRHIYTIADIEQEAADNFLIGEVSGSFKYRTAVPSDFPVTGDWVAFRPASESTAVIEHVLPRRTKFSRKTAGARTDEQIVASNIDVIFLVFGLDGGRNYTSGGLERYVTLAWNSGAVPVIILNKADLCSDEYREQVIAEALNAAPGVDIYPISAVTGEGLDSLARSVKPGATVALTGPSGVGKSTIINYLLENDLQRTSAPRAGDLRGRHTTTHREMFLLPSGLILIDTPGLKEIQLWAGEDSLNETFQDILELASECRFSDCSHQAEPGCAVQLALAAGELDARRYDSFLSLQKEIRYLNRRTDEKLAREEKEKWKNIAKLARQFKK